MAVPFPEPTDPAPSRREVLLRYLDYFRDAVLTRVEALPEAELGVSRLPTGWTPLELVVHLTNVERRWLEWGFEGRAVDDPRADRRDGRWWVDPARPAADAVAALRARGRVTREIASRHELDEVGAPGERWDGADPASLERVLLHLVQEYARHAGQFDVVAELAGGPTGE